MAQINVAPNANYTHRMSAVSAAFNVGAGTARIHYRYWIDRHISAGSGSFLLSGGKLFRATVDGTQDNETLTYDWRDYASRTMVEGDKTLTGMTGQRTIAFGLFFEGHSSSFPAASGSGSLVVPWVPPAPTPIGIDQVTGTSLRYRFSSAGTGGSPILEWQAQRASDEDFTTDVQTVASSGTTTFTGLTPGLAWSARARGRNAVGWGPWSTITTVATGDGGWVKDAGAWADSTPWVKVAGVWRQARGWVKEAGVWKSPR